MLGDRAARLFRLLSLHPGPDSTVPAMAGLVRVPLGEARHLAGELVRTGLLTEHAPGRFTTHDLIRAYAHELAQLHQDERLFGHYRQSADQADLLLSPATAPDPPPAVEAALKAVVERRIATARSRR